MTWLIWWHFGSDMRVVHGWRPTGTMHDQCHKTFDSNASWLMESWLYYCFDMSRKYTQIKWKRHFMTGCVQPSLSPVESSSPMSWWSNCVLPPLFWCVSLLRCRQICRSRHWHCTKFLPVGKHRQSQNQNYLHRARLYNTEKKSTSVWKSVAGWGGLVSKYGTIWWLVLVKSSVFSIMVHGHLIAILQSESDKLTILWPGRNQRMRTSCGL